MLPIKALQYSSVSHLQLSAFPIHGNAGGCSHPAFIQLSSGLGITCSTHFADPVFERRYNAWTLTILHPICCLMFTVGFALREYGAFNYVDTTVNLNVYIASTCLIYMAP